MLLVSCVGTSTSQTGGVPNFKPQFGTSFICRTDGPTFESRILWYIEKFMVDTVNTWCPGPVPTKQATMLRPPLLCLKFSFLLRCGAVDYGHHFCHVFTQCSKKQIGKARPYVNSCFLFVCFLEGRGFVLATLANQPIAFEKQHLSVICPFKSYGSSKGVGSTDFMDFIESYKIILFHMTGHFSY